jgi:Ran-binding protein 1
MTDAETAPSGFATAATNAAPAPATDADDTPAAGEDFSGTFAPVVELTEVQTKTGEEDETAVFKIRAKLFRFDKEMSEWKERGTGDVRLLQHKDNNKIRLLMRREKTLKICLNHFVNVAAVLSENVGSDRSWVFHAVDYADGERDDAMLAIRFANPENANLFRDSYNSAREYMKALNDGLPLPKLAIPASATPTPKGVDDVQVVKNVEAMTAEKSQGKEDVKAGAKTEGTEEPKIVESKDDKPAAETE